MDRLREMEMFAVVVDTGSFSGAARRLRLSPEVVSRAVAALEDRLGARLLQRTARSLRLTEPGARFHRGAERAMAAALEAEAEVAGGIAAPQGPLSVAASTSLGRVVVAPALGAFLEAHPGVSGALSLAGCAAGPLKDGIDVAVLIGARPDRGARRVGSVRRIMVASPAYLARHGTPAMPEALRDHAVVGLADLMPERALTFAAGTVRVSPRVEVDDAAAAVALAESGQGIAPVPSFLARGALAEGRLLEVLADHAPAPEPVHLVFPELRPMSPTVRAFAEHAAPRLAASLA